MFADRFDDDTHSVSLFTNLFSYHSNSKWTADSNYFRLEKKIKDKELDGYYLRNKGIMTVKYSKLEKQMA